MLTLKAGGAQVALCASNPLSHPGRHGGGAREGVRHPGLRQKGEDNKRYYSHIEAVLRTRPQVTMDDGADLISQLHARAARARA